MSLYPVGVDCVAVDGGVSFAAVGFVGFVGDVDGDAFPDWVGAVADDGCSV